MSENSQQKKLSPKQRRAIDALLSGMSKGEAAAAVGVNARTLSRWLNEDIAFFDELQQAGRAAVHDATRRLTATLDTAVSVFQGVMDNPGQEGASIKLRAANYAATHALKLIEVSDILERLAALESRLP